jgi:hypothetical protein
MCIYLQEYGYFWHVSDFHHDPRYGSLADQKSADQSQMPRDYFLGEPSSLLLGHVFHPGPVQEIVREAGFEFGSRDCSLVSPTGLNQLSHHIPKAYYSGKIVFVSCSVI